MDEGAHARMATAFRTRKALTDARWGKQGNNPYQELPVIGQKLTGCVGDGFVKRGEPEAGEGHEFFG